MTDNKSYSKFIKFVPYILLFAIICALYLKTADYSLVYNDDDVFILQNAPRYAESVLNVFKSNVFFGGITLYYRPILTLSFMADNKIAGASEQAARFTNIFLHILSCFIIYFFLRRYLFSREAFFDEAFAFLAAAVFAVHPQNIYTVVWIAGRNDSLFLVFFFLSFIPFIEYFKTRPAAFSQRRCAALLFIHAIFLSALFFTKESAAAAPFIFLFYYFTHKDGASRKLNPPVFIIWAAITILFFTARSFALSGVHADFSALVNRFDASALYMFAQYLSGAFFLIVPFGTEPEISQIITGTAALAALILAFIKQKQNLTKASFWFLLPFILLIPTVPGVRLWAQLNRMYLPLFALIVLCFSFFYSRTDKTKKAFLICVPFFICLSFCVSFNKSVIFKDGVSFWGQVFSEFKNPPKIIRTYYVTALINGARLDEAFQIISDSNPGENLSAADAYNLGVYYFIKEEYANAGFFFSKALEKKGFKTHENYANLYLCAKYMPNSDAARYYKTSALQTGISDAAFEEIAKYTDNLLKSKRAGYLKDKNIS